MRACSVVNFLWMESCLCSCRYILFPYSVVVFPVIKQTLTDDEDELNFEISHLKKLRVCFGRLVKRLFY